MNEKEKNQLSIILDIFENDGIEHIVKLYTKTYADEMEDADIHPEKIYLFFELLFNNLNYNDFKKAFYKAFNN